ncbi:tetratricopeptide repeat protein [Arcobacter sp. YIC-464]|uniref:tetratricopeptide repeat protein n=1 Tax=Arcobacter sp. YIC-464 TaxID=3376631 RepID=UPI003C211CF8
MNKYLTTFLITAALGTATAEEVSVFGAGDLNSKNPYGLNSAEKHILKNQQKLTSLNSKINDVNLLIDSLKKRLEGLESIYEGDSSKLNSTVLRMNELMKQVEMSSELATKNSSDTAEIKSVSEQLLNMKEETDKEMRASIATLKNAVSKISKLVNKINKEYVSASELRKNMDQFITRAEFESLKKSLGVKTTSVVPSTSTSTTVEKTESNKTLSSSDKEKILDEAKKQYSKQYFKYAIPKFEKLIALNYKPAESNYYLGEMWYVRKKYDLAISHFKKSAILNDKAAYMPSLLLHSAISFEATGDKENARSFYSTLIDLYPSSDETKIAKKNLNKL